MKEETKKLCEEVDVIRAATARLSVPRVNAVEQCCFVTPSDCLYFRAFDCFDLGVWVGLSKN